MPEYFVSHLLKFGKSLPNLVQVLNLSFIKGKEEEDGKKPSTL